MQIEEIVSLRGKMAQAVVGKKFGIEQTEVSAIQRMQRVKTARLADESDKKVHYCNQSFYGNQRAEKWSSCVSLLKFWVA